tara:strand:- start:262 stop:480 length:219 start_codon:yes stop_codon:yes gene_type:complete
MGYRIIYNDTIVFDLFNTNGTTYTPHNIYNGSDLDDCFNKIDELALPYEYPTGTTQCIVFSAGTRTIIDLEG